MTNPLDAYKPDVSNLSVLQKRLDGLVEIRDRVNALNAPLEAKLAEASARREKARIEAAALAAQIDDNRGREKWLALKREIGQVTLSLQNLKRRS